MSDRKLYLGRSYRIFTSGGWEFVGKIIDVGQKYFLVDQDGDITEIKRKYIVGMTRVSGKRTSFVGQEVKQDVPYNMPIGAVAKIGEEKMTPLQEKLLDATKKAQKIAVGEDDYSSNHYGVSLPSDMLMETYSDSSSNDEVQVDLGISFNTPSPENLGWSGLNDIDSIIQESQNKNNENE